MNSERTQMDSLEQEQIYFQNQYNPVKAVKNFYKIELDNMINEKNKNKLVERQKQLEEKKKYNERCEQAKELQKIKDVSYKNYYQMLLSNQQNHIENYISPFSKRDSMKNQFINHSVEEQKRRAEQQERMRIQRMTQMRDSYKRGLLNQLEQKKFNETVKKNQKQIQKEMYQRISKIPQELDQYQRQRRRQQMNKYKQDLDKGKHEKQFRKLGSQLIQSQNRQSHNTLTNPMPYNIQNPYIIKQMQRNGLMKNSSYLANIGNNHLV